jgi:hypothetical protein
VDELLLSAIECAGVGGIRQTETQTAELFVPQPSISEVEVVSPSHWWFGRISPYLVWLLTFQSSVDVILESLGAILPFCGIGNI